MIRPITTAMTLSLAALVTLAACGSKDTSLSAADPSPSQSGIDAPSTPIAPSTHPLEVLVQGGGQAPDAVVEMPRGFDDDDATWYVVSHDRNEFLGLWMVEKVDADACHSGGKDAFDPGSSVRDLADALVDQQSTSASRPAKVTLAGYDGLYVELAGPRRLDRCDRHPALWRVPERGIYNDGQVDQVWILDIGGQRIVVNASYRSPQSSPSDIDRLRTLVNSLEFR